MKRRATLLDRLLIAAVLGFALWAFSGCDDDSDSAGGDLSGGSPQIF